MTLDLQTLRESDRLEFKKSDGKLSADFWPTYSAFANTNGGTIVIGLMEDGQAGAVTPVGVKDPDKTVNDIWVQVNNPQMISVNILTNEDIRVDEIDGKAIIVVNVPRAERRKRPVYINGNMNSGTYRRNGGGDYHCTVNEIAEMLRDSREDSADSSLCSRVLMKDLDDQTIESFRNMMSNRTPGHPWNMVPSDEFLRLIGAADYGSDGVLMPTVAGVLMFGRDYSIVREIPHYMLDYLEYGIGGDDWDVRRTTYTGDWTGNLFEFFMFVANRLALNSPNRFELDGMMRVDDSDLLKAEREMVLNGLAHADYSGSGGVRVELRHCSLTVRNPGTFRIPVKLAESGGHSDPRNPNVMRMFMLIGLVERAGSGVHRMVTTCSRMGLGEPEIAESVDPSTVTVSMRTCPSVHNGTPAGQTMFESVLDAIKARGDATVAEIASMTGMSKSTVSRRIHELKDSGKLRREGTNRGGRWVVEE